MKKILFLTSVLAVGFAAGGCNKYDYKEPVQTLFVVESDLDFTADGGTGAIYVRSDKGAITAESNKDWCTVSVSDMTVNVTVAPLADIRNRTALVTVKSGGESQAVPVTQSSGRFILESTEIEVDWVDGAYQVGYTSFGPVTAETDDDWITVRVEGDVIVIEVVENPSHVDKRVGQVMVKAGDVVLSINVNQKAGPFYKILFADMYGEWTLSYTDSLGAPQSFPVSFAKLSTNKFNVSGFPDEKQAQKMTFSSTTCNLTFQMGQWIYSITGVSKRFMVGVDSLAMEANGATSIYLTGKFNGQEYDQEYTFIDAGKWAGHSINGIAYGIYDDTSVYTGKYYNVMYNIKLSRTIPKP